MDGIQQNILENVDVNTAVVQHSQGEIERLNPCVLRGIEGGTLHFIAVPRSNDEEYIDHTLLNPEFLTASIQNGIVVDIVQTQQQSDGANDGGSGSLITNTTTPLTYHATNNNISGQIILQSHHETNQNNRSQFVQEIDTNHHPTVINSGANNKNHQSTGGIIIQSDNNSNNDGIMSTINDSHDRRLFVQYVQKSGGGLQHHQNTQQILHTGNEAQVIVSNTINSIHHQHQLQQDVPPLAPISRHKQGRYLRTVPIIRPPQHQQSDQLITSQQQPVISSMQQSKSSASMSIVKLEVDSDKKNNKNVDCGNDSDSISIVKKRLKKRLSVKQTNLPHKKRITTACSDGGGGGGGGGNSYGNNSIQPLTLFKRIGTSTQHDTSSSLQQIIQKPQRSSNKKKQQLNSLTAKPHQNQSLQIFEVRHSVDSNQTTKNQFNKSEQSHQKEQQQQQQQQHENDDHQTHQVTYEIRNIEEFIGNPHFHHEIVEQTNLSSSEQHQQSQTLLAMSSEIGDKDEREHEITLVAGTTTEQHQIHPYTCEICGKVAENQFNFFTHLKYHYEPSMVEQQQATTPPQSHSILQNKNIHHGYTETVAITPTITKSEPSFNKSANEILYFNTSNLTTITTTSETHNENNRITIELPVISNQHDHQIHQNHQQQHVVKNNDDSNEDDGVGDGGLCNVDNNDNHHYDDCSNSIINDNANISNLQHEHNDCNKISQLVKAENSIVISTSMTMSETTTTTASPETTIVQQNEFSDTEDMLEGIRSAVDKVQQSVDNDWNENDAAAADAAAAAATSIDESKQSSNIWFDTDNSNIPIIYRLPDDDHPRLTTTTNKLHINRSLRDQLLKREEETIINDDGSTMTTHFIVDGQLVRQTELISTGADDTELGITQSINVQQQHQPEHQEQAINNLVFHELQTKPNSDGSKTTTSTTAPDKSKRKKKLYDCKYCEKVCNSKNSLRYHMLSHTGERPHKCDQCGKGFFSSSALKVHKRLHTGIKPYSCEICNRAFRQWGDLKYHITSLHTEEKNHQCEFCGKDFARRYSLVVHRRIHTGEKNYKCEYCDKTFRASSYLQDHRKIHTGEKPHVCEHCGKKFRVRGDLKRHWNIHTRPWAAKKIKEPGMGISMVANAINSISSDEVIMITNDQDVILDSTAININPTETNNSFDVTSEHGQNSTVDLTDIYLYESTNNKDQHMGNIVNDNTDNNIKQYVAASHQNKMLTATITSAQVAGVASPISKTKTTTRRKSKTVKTNASKRFKGTTPILKINKELQKSTPP